MEECGDESEEKSEDGDGVVESGEGEKERERRRGETKKKTFTTHCLHYGTHTLSVRLPSLPTNPQTPVCVCECASHFFFFEWRQKKKIGLPLRVNKTDIRRTP
jgi:hypothetical protein